jgi:hypothetical protein
MAKPDVDSYKLKLTGTGVSVERSVNELVARQIMDLVMGGAGSGGGQPTSPGTLGPSTGGADSSTPKAFMAGKRPRTDMERITCLAYYLTHNRSASAFKTKDLTDLSIEAAQQKLSNPSATARNAVEHGFLALAGGGRKQITPRGEAVVDALPDRDKVKTALTDHRVRKPRKKRVRKAK